MSTLKTLPPSTTTPLRTAEAISRARALRAEYAWSAASQALRAELARANGRYAEAARWRHEYRHSVARCRALGEMIRAGNSPSTPGPGPASTATPLFTPRPDDVGTAGEAA